jgi:hypothetical protein
MSGTRVKSDGGKRMSTTACTQQLFCSARDCRLIAGCIIMTNMVITIGDRHVI